MNKTTGIKRLYQYKQRPQIKYKWFIWDSKKPKPNKKIKLRMKMFLDIWPCPQNPPNVLHHQDFALTVASCFPHLYFGSDVCLATLRPPPDPWLVLWQSVRALRSAQHGAGWQLGVCFCVRERLLGEAQWCHLGRTGFIFHHQDRRREDGDWRGRGEALLEASTGHWCSIQIQIWKGHDGRIRLILFALRSFFIHGAMHTIWSFRVIALALTEKR